VANKPVDRQVVKALGDYLKLKIPTLQQVLEQFPEANEQLKYPSVSIHATAPGIQPLSPPWILSKGTTVNHEATVKWVTGELSWRLQVDLWARNKFERSTLLDQIRNVFRSQFPVEGLSLPMADYHGVICRFDMETARFDDSEASAQRKEWRCICTVQANCFEILEKVEKIIETIGITLVDSVTDIS
jgi:hypothetical protein